MIPPVSPTADGRQDGAAAVEFALVLPLLLLLILGIVDFSLAYSNQIALSGGAREGVRVLALGAASPDPRTITKEGAPSVPADEISVKMFINGTEVSDVGACNDNPGAQAKITASYNYDYMLPLSGLIEMVGASALTSPIELTGIGVMRCGG